MSGCQRCTSSQSNMYCMDGDFEPCPIFKKFNDDSVQAMLRATTREERDAILQKDYNFRVQHFWDGVDRNKK